MSSAIRTEVDVGVVESDRDLDQILALQQRNLVPGEDGFVTVRHTKDILRALHEAMPSVVARHGGDIVAYALSMPREARGLLPILEPMFQRLDALPLLAGRPFYVMGQICVDEGFRGCGLVDRLYAEHQARHGDRFEWIVTEIAMRNPRSRRAHARVGFVEIDRYRDATDDWSVVGWCFPRA